MGMTSHYLPMYLLAQHNLTCCMYRCIDLYKCTCTYRHDNTMYAYFHTYMINMWVFMSLVDLVQNVWYMSCVYACMHDAFDVLIFIQTPRSPRGPWYYTFSGTTCHTVFILL